MNKETLDALLIDRALGALPPDTEALLAAYLAQNPAAAVDLEQTLEVVGIARDTLDAEPSALLPEFRAPRTARRRRQYRYTLQFAGMAAMLAIGLTVGRHLSGASTVRPPTSIGVAVQTGPTLSSENGIWSISAYLRERQAARSARPDGRPLARQPNRAY